MAQYIIRRCLISIPILFGISIISFLVMHLAPGGPTSLLLDPSISKDAMEAFKERYGLNDPIHIQYIKWITAFIQGDMGYSIVNTGAPVSKMIAARLPNRSEEHTSELQSRGHLV